MKTKQNKQKKEIQAGADRNSNARGRVKTA